MFFSGFKTPVTYKRIIDMYTLRHACVFFILAKIMFYGQTCKL